MLSNGNMKVGLEYSSCRSSGDPWKRHVGKGWCRHRTQGLPTAKTEPPDPPFGYHGFGDHTTAEAIARMQELALFDHDQLAKVGRCLSAGMGSRSLRLTRLSRLYMSQRLEHLPG